MAPLGMRAIENHYDAHAFDGRRKKHNAVSARTGLAFADMERMRIVRRSTRQCRKSQTPWWAENDALLREIVLKYCERRYFVHPRKGATNEERLRAIRDKEQSCIPGFQATLQRLTLTYHLAHDSCLSPEALQEIAIQIQNVDTQIQIAKRGTASLVTAVAYHYYRLHRTSVDTANELGVKPPMVRVWIHRLNRVADGTP